jgi:antitoxin component HigA of HigAB toxin-antitoxin module
MLRGIFRASSVRRRTSLSGVPGLEKTVKNSVLEADPKRYGRLLARKLPAVIRTEEKNQRLAGELEDLDRRHDELAPEEREYAELLTVLVEAFEEAHYALEGPAPDSRLRSLMEEHGLRQRDLLDVLVRFAGNCFGGGKREAGDK